MHKSLLIFDFDGTIADTLRIAVKIANELGEEFGFRKVTQGEFVELKSKSVPELMRMAGLSWIQLPLFIKRARDSFKANLKLVPPITDMPEILHTLQQRGYRMGIVTSNTEEGVSRFLEDHHMQMFEFIDAPDSLFGKAKAIKRIIKKQQLRKRDVIMIGDELRDMEAAEKVGIDGLAVTWGFNSPKLLATNEQAHIIHDPKELLDLFPPKPDELASHHQSTQQS